MTRRLTCIAALCAVALATLGCSSPDYSRARQSRFERPYLGGAANVPGDEPSTARAGPPPSTFDLLAFLGVFAIAFTHGVDHVGPLPQSFPTAPADR